MKHDYQRQHKNGNNRFDFGKTLIIGILVAGGLAFLGGHLFPKQPLVLATLPNFAQANVLKNVACPFGDVDNIRCVTLTVPQDHTQSDGPIISIFAMIASPAGGTKVADPLLYLEGGPGYASIVKQKPYYEPDGLFYSAYGDIFKSGRDVIFVDTRGLGLSEPAIGCPNAAEVFYQELKLKPEKRSSLKEFEHVRDCLNTLNTNGIDIAQYNSDAVARDLKMLRQALNIELWNLYGISYGARTALSVLDVDRAGVRSVIFDSPSYDRVDIFPSDQASFDRVLNEIEKLCQTAKSVILKDQCRGGDIVARVDALMVKLKDNPLPVRTSPVTRPFWIDPQEALLLFHDVLYASTGYSTFLEMLDAFENQGYGYFSSLNEWGALWFDNLNWHYLDDAYSMAVYYSTACREMDFSRDHIPGGHDLFTLEEAALQRRLCDEVEIPRESPVLKADKFRGVPALILSGQRDVITPPNYGKALARDISGDFILHPNESHGVMFWSDDDCVRDMALGFLGQQEIVQTGSCPARLAVGSPS